MKHDMNFTRNNIEIASSIRSNDKAMKQPLSAFLALGIVLATVSSAYAQKSNDEKEPSLIVRQIGYGHLAARALHVACYYKLFDILQDGPKTAAQMVKGTPYNANAVKRLMRVLANHQLVQMDKDEKFSLNENSKVLISTAKESLQPAMAKEFALPRWEAVGNVHLTMTQNVIPFDHINKVSFYDYLETDAEAAKLFNTGMKNFSEQEDEQVSNLKLFQQFASYCDIGGGTGGLISRVISKNPKLHGILFDLPKTVQECKLSNLSKQGGSFFDAVPSAEIFTLKRVLHNWDDQQCVKILNNTVRALSNSAKGRILVIEKVLPQTVDGSFLADSDMIGLALGGTERTLQEFIKLGRDAELEFEQQIPLSSGVSVLVFKVRHA